jgi:hypothetical protein
MPLAIPDAPMHRRKNILFAITEGVAMKSILRTVAALHMTTILIFTSAVNAGDAVNLLIIRSSQKPPAAVVTAIKAYAQGKKWLYLGDNVVKNGEVTLVKICIPAAGKYVWAAGMEYSAMLPCGNLSLYRKDGTTQISLLDPGFMNLLHPDPNLKKLGDETRPLFESMLEAVTK